jgi:outer membrane lipoprotein-sorting protein
MDGNNKSLQSLQASVTMVKTNVQLNVSDTSIGTTKYLPKNDKRVMYVRIDWTKPVEEQMAVIGDTYELYRPRLNQVIQGVVQKAKNNAAAGGALSFMSMSKEQLRSNYDVQYIAQEQISGGIQTWHILLKPKVQTSYKVADLWVDADGMPRQARITEKNDDTTTVLLTGIQKNVKIDSNVFRLAYDKKKVKIVKA